MSALSGCQVPYSWDPKACRSHKAECPPGDRGMFAERWSLADPNQMIRPDPTNIGIRPMTSLQVYKKERESMSTWKGIRDKAVSGLSTVAQEGSRQAKKAATTIQLAQLNASWDGALRDLGAAVLAAKESGTPLNEAETSWVSIWETLEDLSKSRQTLETQESPASEPVQSMSRFCPECGESVVG